MTRKIKAQDLKPGMKIEWTEYGWTHSGTVSEVQDPNRSSLFISFRAADELWMCVDKDLKVTVLKDPQPEEPTAFGACVEVAGVKYVRCDDDELEWKSSAGDGWWGWIDLCDKGHVTVVNPDPFASAEPREPRVWDRWEDVPQMTAVRVQGLESLFRKRGCDVERLSCGEWWSLPSMAGASAPFRGTFMEVALGA